MRVSRVIRYRKTIHFLATFLTTLYLLVVFNGDAGAGGSGHNFVQVLHALLPDDFSTLSKALVIGGLPLLVFWVLVLRITHIDSEEKMIRELRQSYGVKGVARDGKKEK